MIRVLEEPSPLIYPRAGNVQRFALYDPDFVTIPFEVHDAYFAPTQHKVWTSAATGRRLKNPRIEHTPGSRPGTLAWIDWHLLGPDALYINFMKTRRDWHRQGIARGLVDEFYTHMVEGRGIKLIHWGKVVHPGAWRLYETMRARYPNVQHLGHRDF